MTMLLSDLIIDAIPLARAVRAQSCVTPGATDFTRAARKLKKRFVLSASGSTGRGHGRVLWQLVRPLYERQLMRRGASLTTQYSRLHPAQTTCRFYHISCYKYSLPKLVPWQLFPGSSKVRHGAYEAQDCLLSCVSSGSQVSDSSELLT